MRDRSKSFRRRLALCVGMAGISHFAISLLAWGFFYVGSYRNHWKEVFTPGYMARHLLPVLVLLGMFILASVAFWRRRRGGAFVLGASMLLSLCAFVVDVRGEPQLQRIWFEEPTRACSSRQNFYCTWWWWQPQIR